MGCRASRPGQGKEVGRSAVQAIYRIEEHGEPTRKRRRQAGDVLRGETMNDDLKCVSCDCTFSSGCRAERVAAEIAELRKTASVRYPRPRRGDGPGIRQQALAERAVRRAARELRKTGAKV